MEDWGYVITDTVITDIVITDIVITDLVIMYFWTTAVKLLLCRHITAGRFNRPSGARHQRYIHHVITAIVIMSSLI
jgi:hypothetical protein